MATMEPLIVQLADEPITQGFIRIIDTRTGGSVVTVIEFINPSNKVPGAGNTTYLRKQQEVWEARANLVEIDLTRAGRRSLVLPVEHIPPSHRRTYQVCVRRESRPLELAVYPLPLAEPLPKIAVPLREGDADVPLDLQDLIERCYRSGRYDDLDYGSGLEPPLSPEDEAWARELLRSSGRGK